jgi:hypothetical protein
MDVKPAGTIAVNSIFPVQDIADLSNLIQGSFTELKSGGVDLYILPFVK